MLAVSSEQQAETLAHQQRMAEQAAAQKGWQIDRVIGAGREGVGSGKAGVRAVIALLIAELRALEPAERPAWVWMRRVDRTGRGRAAESLVALHEIADLGVRIWDHDTGEVRLDTAEGELVAALKAGLARMENQTRIGKALAGYERRRAAGKVAANKRPYGLMLGPDGRDHVDQERAPIVQEVFRLRAERLGRLSIARQVGPGAPPFRLADGTTKPVVWDTKAIRRMLSQRAYVPDVIDEVTFARIQGIEADMHGTPGERREHARRPLVGVVRCFCGAMMYWQAHTGQGGEIRWPYYVCRATWNHGKHRMIRAADLEAKFVSLLRRLAATPELLESYRRRSYTGPSPRLLERAIGEARTELTAVTRAQGQVWALHAAGHLRDEHVAARLDEIMAQRDEIEQRIAQLQTDHALASAASIPRAHDDLADRLPQMAARWATLRPEAQRLFARSLLTYLGGLCLEEDGTLAVRKLAPRSRRTRHG